MKRKTASNRMMQFVLLACIAIVSIAAAGYGLMDDASSRRLLLKLDVLGISRTAALENQRIRTIMTLPVTYERKQALVDNKIFMGATPEMVRLALGPPKLERYRPATLETADIRVWHYYLPGESRPTVMEFETDILVKAYKGSAIDVP